MGSGSFVVCSVAQETAHQEHSMRFMIIVKSTAEFEAEPTPMPEEKLMAQMAEYHEELARSGVLLDASGLQPSRRGWRIEYEGQKRTIVDGPFAEAKELIAGFTLIQVRSREEALEWSRRFPNPVGEDSRAVIEVRQLYELGDFPPSAAVERFREIDTPSQHEAHPRTFFQGAPDVTPDVRQPAYSQHGSQPALLPRTRL
jgi:hypothetical protein